MEWGQAESRYLSVKKVYPISKFLSTKEMINALDIYKSSQLDSDELRLLPNFSWPKLKSFKSGDKTREVYLVDCKVTNDKVGIDLIGIPMRVVISDTTMKRGNYEVTDRMSGETALLSCEDIMKKLQDGADHD